MAMAMGRGSAAWLCGVIAVLSTVVLQGVSGITYTVGDANGWRIMDYSAWLSGKTFKSADILVFTYGTPQHDLVEVNKSDYDTCTSVSPIASYTDGSTMITLGPTDTIRYFICSLPGHCTAGMKIAIPVTLATATSPSPATTPVAPVAAPTPAAAITPTPISPIVPTPAAVMPPPSLAPTPTAPTLAPTPSILAPTPTMTPGPAPIASPVPASSSDAPVASPTTPSSLPTTPSVSSPPAPPPAPSDSKSAPSFSPFALVIFAVFSFLLH